MQALEAGADLVLMPADPWQALEAIVAAVREGRLSRERLQTSAERRGRALARVPVNREDGDAARPLGALTNGPVEEDRALLIDLLRRSLDHQGGVVRRPGEESGVALLRVDDPLGCRFLPANAPALELPRAAGFRPWVLDVYSPLGWAPEPSEGKGLLPPWTRAGIQQIGRAHV